MPDSEKLDYAPVVTADESLALDTRIRLSIMMFMQYAVWGAWWMVLSIYLKKLGFTGPQTAQVYATTAVASIFAPPIIGQLADRWVPTQYLLSISFLVGSVVLFAITQFTGFAAVYTLILIWAVVFIPTITLTNSLSFHHIPNAQKHFPSIRVFGTIGWIVAAQVAGFTLSDDTYHPILMAAVISLVMGIYCLIALPKTPPSGEPGQMLEFLKAVSLLKSPNFLLFIIVAFCLSVVLAGYFTFSGQFLDAVGMPRINAVMTAGQISEMILLPFLPLFLKKLGMKKTLLLGMAAWGVRYGIFAAEPSLVIIVLAIALHGVCYDFFFVAAYIHVDNKADKAMRASAQGFFNFVTMGLGMYLGNLIFGYIVKANTSPEGVTTWPWVWGIPAIGVVVCLIIFWFGFHNRREEMPAGAVAS